MNPLSREIDLDMDFDRIETREDVLRWLAVSFSKDAPGGGGANGKCWMGGGWIYEKNAVSRSLKKFQTTHVLSFSDSILLDFWT